MKFKVIANPDLHRIERLEELDGNHRLRKAFLEGSLVKYHLLSEEETADIEN